MKRSSAITDDFPEFFVIFFSILSDSLVILSEKWPKLLSNCQNS